MEFEVEIVESAEETQVQSAVPTRKMASSEGRMYSKIWNHFDKIAGKGECHYCNAKVSVSAGSTGNLKRHLQSKHPNICLNAKAKYEPPADDGNESSESMDLKTILVRTLAQSGNEKAKAEVQRICNESPKRSGAVEKSNVGSFIRERKILNNSFTPQHAVKRKLDSHRDQRLDKAYQLLAETTNQMNDECQLFANFIASKLRAYEGTIRSAIENDIMDIFLKANRGFYNSYNTVIYEEHSVSTPNSTSNPNVHYVIPAHIINESSTSRSTVTNEEIVVQEIL